MIDREKSFAESDQSKGMSLANYFVPSVCEELPSVAAADSLANKAWNRDCGCFPENFGSTLTFIASFGLPLNIASVRGLS